MSDYLFMLESHLSPSQREAVAAVEAAGAAAGEQTFLVGGALRDMLGGYPITDLDFAVQGNALALAQTVAQRTGAEIVDSDAHYKTAELRFPSGVTAEIGMARTETFAKAGGRPVVKPAAIHDDLLRRDFTMNSIALSLHPASKGLLLDPCNGAADIGLREIRAHGNYGFHDDPSRMLRLVRLQIRLGFAVDERTQRQFDSAKEAGMESRVPARALFHELRAVANELSLCNVLTALAAHGFLTLISPALNRANLNLGALSKLERARQMIPYGINLNLDPLGLFFYALTEKLTPKERDGLVKALSMREAEVEIWQKLESRSKKLERELKSTKLRRTSDLYYRLLANPGDELLFLFLHSKERLVHDRIKAFLQKHLYTVIEVTDRDVTTQSGVEPGDPRFAEFKEQIIIASLDGRKWKPPIVKGLKPAIPARKAATKTKRKAAAEAAAKKAALAKAAAAAKPAGNPPAKSAKAKNVAAMGAVAHDAVSNSRARVKKKAAASKTARKAPAKA